jgi:hypothetical protein
VVDGSASSRLDLGFRSTPSRSIKAEIEFPLTRNVSEATLFDRILETPQTTVCGQCHVSEVKRDFPGFPSGAFESDVFLPYDADQVSLESARSAAASCDRAAEPDRCGLLSALFDHGDVMQGQLGGQ